MENAALERSDQPLCWDRILAVLKPDMNPGIYETWFRPTQQIHYDGDSLRVSVPNEMFAEWLRSQYLGVIENAMPKAGVPEAELIFVPHHNDPAPARTAAPVAADQSLVPPRLNTRYTFENFVVSSCNQFAHAAALAITDQLGGAYNPLFIYGGVGLGKTHLMQAIGNYWVHKKPGIRLRYLTSEQFINELITAIRFEKTLDFRHRYRNVEILLVDDIQFIAGKESTQEEFFHTFNDLYDQGMQIVLASDKPPREIPSLAERLRSRFEWGLIADIQPPDLETKIAILNKVAESRRWSLDPEVGLFIASQIKSNIRELEGCLTTVMAAASISRRPADLALAREIVRTAGQVEEDPVTIDAILRVVAKHYGLKVSELKSKTNAKRISFPRQVAMYLAKTLAGESYPTIGKVFGGKHHTTVLHAVRKITTSLETDLALHNTVRQLEEELR